MTPASAAEAARVMRSVLTSDLGGYQPRWHRDLDDLLAAYGRDPRRTLFLARVAGVPAGTAAVRPCQLATPPNPLWLAQRYNDPSVCELVRVWIPRAHRRMGIARRLIERAGRWAIEEGGYRTLYLHTDTSVPGAEPFWRSMPTIEIHDARPGEFNCVHFELDPLRLLAGDAGWASAGRS